MKIFLSWSGERSRLFAKALREWLPLVVHYAEPWLSDTDISAGDRWSSEVSQQLELSNFGILCLTRDNAASPWILFEAGALGKFMEQRAVCPYLLDIEFSELAGPISQFQAKKSDKVSSFALVESINKRATSPLPAERLAELFEALWPRLDQRISEIQAKSELSKPAKKTHDVIETMVAGLMRLEAKMNNIEESIADIKIAKGYADEIGKTIRSYDSKDQINPFENRLDGKVRDNDGVISEAHAIEYLLEAFRVTAGGEEWVNVAQLGLYLSDNTPVDYRNYGYKKLGHFLYSTDLFKFNQVSKTKLEVALAL